MFGDDGVQFHVTYTHGWNDTLSERAGAGVRGRKVSTWRMTCEALRVANAALSKSTEVAWLGYSTNYTQTTDSIGVDA